MMTKKINTYCLIIFLALTGCSTTQVDTTDIITKKPAIEQPQTQAITHSERNIQNIMSDENLVKALKLNLQKDPIIKQNSTIEIGAFNRHVLLYGWVKDAKTKKIIQKRIKQSFDEHPIEKVYNHLSTSPPATTFENSNCSWLSTKIRTALITSTKLTTRHIQIFCYKNTIYVLGGCYDNERNAILKLIKAKSGNRKIISNLLTLKLGS